MLQLLLFVLILFTAGCGRKRKDFFVFETNGVKPRSLRRLETVKQVVAVTQPDGFVLLKWVKPTLQLYDSEMFAGYNVYRLRSWGIIPRKPINKKPLIEEFFIDKHMVKNEYCYAVSMVFTQKKEASEGPLSKIVSRNCF